MSPLTNSANNALNILGVSLNNIKASITGLSAEDLTFTNGSAVRYQSSFSTENTYVLSVDWKIASTDLVTTTNNDAAFIIVYSISGTTITPQYLSYYIFTKQYP